MHSPHVEKITSLPINEIRTLLDNGMRQADVAKLFNVSQSTISRCAGCAPEKKSKKNIPLCSCCRKRPIAKGQRMLCRVCYQAQNTAEHTVWAC